MNLSAAAANGLSLLILPAYFLVGALVARFRNHLGLGDFHATDDYGYEEDATPLLVIFWPGVLLAIVVVPIYKSIAKFTEPLPLSRKREARRLAEIEYRRLMDKSEEAA